MLPNERESAVRNLNHIPEGYPPETLTLNINEVMRYMVDSGVPKRVVESPAAVYSIAQGVDERMRGEGDYSKYFKDCVNQLSAYDESEETE